VFDEHIRDQGLKNLTSKLSPHSFPNMAVSRRQKQEWEVYLTFFDDGKTRNVSIVINNSNIKAIGHLTTLGIMRNQPKPFVPKCPPP
jgi:hypothetical protein